jgi:hypothetical protein
MNKSSKGNFIMKDDFCIEEAGVIFKKNHQGS